MAIPNAPLEGAGSKLHFFMYDNVGVNAASVARAIKATTINGEVFGHLAIGTHVDTSTYAAGDAVCLSAGINGTDIIPIAVNADGEIGIHDGGNSITVDGTVAISGTVTVATHAVTQSGTWNIGTVTTITTVSTVTAVTSITNALPAGANTLGGTLDPGWDNAAKAPLQGIVNDVSATTAQILQSADASNLYNIYTIWYSFYSGSTPPAAFRTIKFRYASGGTTFHTIYIPPTAELTNYGCVTFRIPVRTSTNNDVDVILSGALGTGGVYSAGITCHKSTS